MYYQSSQIGRCVINLYAFKKTSILPVLTSSICPYKCIIYAPIPQIAPPICPAMAPTVSQSPPILALIRASSWKLLLCQTVCKAIERASMQQEPMQPGCCFVRHSLQVKFGDFQFQFRSAGVLLKFRNFFLQVSACFWNSSSDYSWLSAKQATVSIGLNPTKSLQAFSTTPLQSSSSPRLTNLLKINARSRQHSFASSPLCVVLLDFSENSIHFSSLSIKQRGTGARRIRDPLPLLNLSPYQVQGYWCFVYQPMEIAMFPPRPIEYLRPPLLRPCSSHMWNMYRMCLASKVKLLRSKLSAIQSAILQSSVQMPTFPDLVSKTLTLICLTTSLKSCAMRSLLSLTKGINQVEAPSASQIAKPKKQATPLQTFLSRPSNLTSRLSGFSQIYLKMTEKWSRSSSWLSIMLKILQKDSLSFLGMSVGKQYSGLRRSWYFRVYFVGVCFGGWDWGQGQGWSSLVGLVSAGQSFFGPYMIQIYKRLKLGSVQLQIGIEFLRIYPKDLKGISVQFPMTNKPRQFLLDLKQNLNIIFVKLSIKDGLNQRHPRKRKQNRIPHPLRSLSPMAIGLPRRHPGSRNPRGQKPIDLEKAGSRQGRPRNNKELEEIPR